MSNFGLTRLDIIQTIAVLPDMLTLRVSTDGGQTWGDGISQGMGTIGQYGTSISFWNLGMSRNMMFRLTWSSDYKTALMGAFVATEIAST